MAELANVKKEKPLEEKPNVKKEKPLEEKPNDAQKKPLEGKPHIEKEQPLDIVINVGGIQYTLNREKQGINYLFRSYNDFETTFKNVADRSKVPFEKIQQLFIKYMRVEPFREQDFGAIPANDKIVLKKILEHYLKYLKYSSEISSKAVVNSMFDRTYHNIQKIIEAIGGKPQDFSKMSVTCTQSKKKLIELDDELKKQMILEFTWLLQHPKDIRSERGCKWADMVSELADIRLDDMISQIPREPQQSQDNEKKEDEKEDSKNIDLYNKTKLTQKGGDMSSHIKALFTVLNVAQMSKTPFTQIGGGSATDDFHDVLTKKLSLALLPLFDSIKSMYQPVYGMLESCMIRSHIKKRKILEPLLVLLHISNHFIGSRNECHGIYRIRNTNKVLTPFITTQLQCSMTRIQKMSAAKRKKCLETIHQLSPIRVSSLPKRNAVPSIKKESPLPTVQYITLDGNLTIPPFERFYRKGSEAEKESTFQAITDFFTKDDIYMVYAPSDEIPMNLYEIDYSTVDTKDTHIPIVTHDSYFTSHPHDLQQFVPLVENAIYTNAELVLSIFIALKEKRSK
jgi:hypothetical protein